MKHTFLIFISCICFFTKSKSQQLHYYSGAKIENYDFEERSFVLFSQDSNNIYAFRKHYYSTYYLDIFDKDSLLKLNSIRIPLPSKDTLKYELEALFIRNDSFLVFYSYFDK